MDKPIWSWNNTLRRLGLRARSKHANWQRPKARSLQMENLEPRQLLATDLGIIGFRGDGDDFVVCYEIGGEDSPAFDVDVYRSADGDTADALLMRRRISDPADLSVGTHSVTIEPDFVDVPEDYFLVVQLDTNSEVVETDETNNQRAFEGGIFQTADGTVQVHGDGGQDQYGFLNLGGKQLEIWYDSESPRQFAGFDAYTGVHVRAHGGDDTISMMSLSTADTPFWAFGGDGADLIGQTTGGALPGSLPLGQSDQDIIYNGPSDGGDRLGDRGDLFDLLTNGSQNGRWRAAWGSEWLPSATGRELALTDFSAEEGQLRVEYEVLDGTAAPFEVSVYSSEDGETLGRQLMSYQVTDRESNLGVGINAVSFPAEFEPLEAGEMLVAVLEVDGTINPTEDYPRQMAFQGGEITFVGTPEGIVPETPSQPDPVDPAELDATPTLPDESDPARQWSTTITTVYQLQLMALHPEADYVLAADIDASQTRWWNLGETGFEGFAPIGDAAQPFTGTLDGNGHTISSLFIHRPDEEGVGLFGRVASGASISNVQLAGADITGGDRVGGLAGRNAGRITGSYVSGVVSGKEHVGGLVAFNDASGVIACSYATADVTGNEQVGGLVAEHDGTIVDSYASGQVVGAEGPVGGLVGRSAGTISRAYAAGKISSGEPDKAGGLVGLSSEATRITESFFTDASRDNQLGRGVSLAELTQRETFDTWSCADVGKDVWKMVDGETMPYLSWQTLVSGTVHGSSDTGATGGLLKTSNSLQPVLLRLGWRGGTPGTW